MDLTRQSALSLSLAALLCCGNLFAQSSMPATGTQPETFHVAGTIADPSGNAVYGVSVAFQNGQLRKAVLTNDAGVYEADLPFGNYTMTAQGIGFRPYRRPLFRVAVPISLEFDATLHPHESCETPVFDGPGSIPTEQWAAAQSESCLREDFLSVPSGAEPFRLAIRYGARALKGTVYSYTGEKTNQYSIPVSVAYNLLSLYADKITYDATDHALSASGNVVVRNEPGTIQRGDSVNFRVEDGHANPTTQLTMFHVGGTITDLNGAVIVGAAVAFQSKFFDETVYTDKMGVYDADLPVGDYTMVAEMRQFRPYRRPLLRVTSALHLIFDIPLEIQPTCDIIAVNADAEGREAARKRLCFRAESFPLPSKDGVSFELYVHYAKRSALGDRYAYTGDETRNGNRVLVAYNLFSLQADEVVYDAKTQTIKASGDVVAVDESGATRRIDFASFKMEDGKAIPVP